jgi:hypothetical protein
MSYIMKKKSHADPIDFGITSNIIHIELRKAFDSALGHDQLIN